MDYTLAALRTLLRARLGPSEGAARFWTDGDLDAALRETAATWNRLTGYWAGRVVVPTLAGQPFVRVPATLGWAARVEWRGRPLTPTSLFALDLARGTWQSATPAPPTFWAPIAVTLFALSPPPVASDTALVVDGVLRTPTLATDTDTLRLDRDLEPVLLAYARHLALFSLGVEVWRESLPARAAFWQAAGDRNRRLKASDVYKRVLGIHEQAWLKGKRAGGSTLGVKAPEVEATP